MAMTLSVICLFVHLGLTFGIIYKNHNYDMKTNLQDHVCQPNDVVFNVKLASILICAAKCAQTSDCKSHTYNSVDKDCIGCREKYKEVGQMTSDTGFKYYGDATKNYHQQCDVSVDCNEIETICESVRKKCVCTPGYSFNSSTKSCVSSCSTYGNTYEKYMNMCMDDDHNIGIKSGTLEFCIDFCSTNENCRSFERHWDACWFSSATALTHPGFYKPYNNINYFNRNCE